MDLSTPLCTFPVGPNEEERIALLHSYGILDTKAGDEFDRLTGLVRRVLDVPIALVSLVDSKRQWFKSNPGLEGCVETHRNLAFCAHAIMPTSPDVFVVLDSKLDDRFKDNDLVTGPPFLRFYAGAPLRVTTPEGTVLNLGTVCALDRKPRNNFGVRDKQFLLDIAGIVVGELEQFRSARNAISEESQRYITCTSHELKTPLTILKLATATFKEHFQQGQEDAQNQRRSSLQITSATMLPSSRSRDDRGKEADEMMEVVEQAELACEMMEQMISNAIDSARQRWTGGSNELNLGPVNLRKVVELTERLSNRHHSEFVKFDMDVDDEIPSVIWSDGHLLRRCLVNLVSNAFKYAAETRTCGERPKVTIEKQREMPVTIPLPGRVLIKATVLEKQKRKNFVDRSDLRIDFVGDDDEVSEMVKFIRVEIHDNGSGVPPELQGKLFHDSFVHANTRKAEANKDFNFFTSRQGSGLGLFVASICVKELGGTIGHRSQNGVTSPGDCLERPDLPCPHLGSVFWFDFPFETSLLSQVPSMQDAIHDFHVTAMSTREGLVNCPDDVQVVAGQVGDEGQVSAGWAMNAHSLEYSPETRAFEDTTDMSEAAPSVSAAMSDAPSLVSKAAPSVSELPSPVEHIKKRLLVVDDSIMIQKLVTKNLVKLNYEVDTALNGRVALEKMMTEEYLVVFMDFLMPILDGISATAIFRDWERTTLEEQEGKPDKRQHQFIMGMSANAEESDKVAAFEAGIDHFIPKPVVMKDLTQVVRRVASGKFHDA